MKKAILGIAAALCAFSTPANAAVNLIAEGGGTPQVWEANGNLFGLVGADTRPSVISGGDVDLDFINGLITAGPKAVNLFVCAGGFDVDNALCPTAVTSSIFVNDNERLSNVFILEFESAGNVTWTTQRNNGRQGTGTLSLNTVTQSGPPPIGGAIPEPATWLMLILGFFGVGAALRSKSAASGRREAFA